MSVAEVGLRVRRVLQATAERGGIGLAKTPAAVPPSALPLRTFVHSQGLEATALLYRRRADDILQGRIPLFDQPDCAIGFPPQWNRDPLTGITAPMSFGKQIDYRDERLVGNIKTLWEPSRHLQLVTLAQAWALTRDARYADGCRTLVASWIEQCPYPRGVHWSSSLELAIRLLNWAVAWDLLGGFDAPLFEGAEGRRFRDAWLASVYQHCHFIEGHLSRHSSANNHLLGEWMGLHIASLVWPCWPRSRAGKTAPRPASKPKRCCRTRPTASTASRRCTTTMKWPT